MKPITIDYFTDILCIWAYIGQVRITELQTEFTNQIKIQPRYFPVFGHTQEKFSTQWANKGGVSAYATHVQKVAEDFSHIQLHADVWLKNSPKSSFPAHLLLSAAKTLEQKEECTTECTNYLSESLRHAFFAEAIDISLQKNLLAIVERTSISREKIEHVIHTGEAFATLSLDLKMANELSIKSSPTLIFNDDRQRLTGNIGYKIIQANIKELLNSPNKQQSWC